MLSERSGWSLTSASGTHARRPRRGASQDCSGWSPRRCGCSPPRRGRRRRAARHHVRDAEESAPHTRGPRVASCEQDLEGGVSVTTPRSSTALRRSDLLDLRARGSVSGGGYLSGAVGRATGCRDRPTARRELRRLRKRGTPNASSGLGEWARSDRSAHEDRARVRGGSRLASIHRSAV